MLLLFSRHSSGFRIAPAVLFCVLLTMESAPALLAQADQSRVGQLQEHAHHEEAELNALDSSLSARPSSREIGLRWAALAADDTAAGEFNAAEKAFNSALQLLSAASVDRAFYADTLDSLGSLYLMQGRTAEAMNCRKKALAERQQLRDPLPIARSQSHLAEIALSLKKYKDAVSGAEEAYEAMVKYQDPERVDLVSTLTVLAYARCERHDCTQGVTDAREALAISRLSFQPDSLPVGAALAALGYAESKNGDPAGAEETTRQALRIFKVQLASSDPRLEHAMVQYRECLLAQRKQIEAQQVSEELSAMFPQEKQSCASCSVSVYSLRSPMQPGFVATGNR